MSPVVASHKHFAGSLASGSVLELAGLKLSDWIRQTLQKQSQAND
jgi:hypothetical protein